MEKLDAEWKGILDLQEHAESKNSSLAKKLANLEQATVNKKGLR
jgi:hypothetical protein